jgi:DNA transformation protein and related proteins
MASDSSFVEYVIDQIREAGAVRYLKMFGEYAIYCDGKVVAFVCDNQLFVKPTVKGRAELEEVTEAPPFPGAKPCFLIEGELDNPQAISSLIRVTARELPLPVPKKPKAKKLKAKKAFKDSD